METGNRMTRAAAEARGFTVDTSCYPWLGYKGPRFSPTEKTEVYTDLEARLLAREGLVPAVKRYRAGILGAMVEHPEGDWIKHEEVLVAMQTRASSPTVGAYQGALEVIEREAESGLKSPTYIESIHRELELLTHVALQGCAYVQDNAGLGERDDDSVFDTFYSRPVGEIRGVRFIAEIHVQMGPDDFHVSGDVIEAGQGRSYDADSYVTADAVRRKDAYEDVIARVREKLDEQVARIQKAQRLEPVVAN